MVFIDDKNCFVPKCILHPNLTINQSNEICAAKRERKIANETNSSVSVAAKHLFEHLTLTNTAERHAKAKQKNKKLAAV